MITVACVWVGDKYPAHYVERLRDMVARWLPLDYHFRCYTDKAIKIPGVDMYRPPFEFPGWWHKMNLFSPRFRHHQTIYFDLDTVIVGDLSPLAEWSGTFGICENFTRLAAIPSRRALFCRYGSCVMSIAPDWGADVYYRFLAGQREIMATCPYGDQQAIERLAPDATFLQDALPPGFFVGYRDLGSTKPPGCSVVIFAGAHKPDNCARQWVKDAWR